MKVGRKPKPIQSASKMVRTLFEMAYARGMMNKQIASDLKKTDATITRWKNGMTSPDAMDLEAFAQLVGARAVILPFVHLGYKEN